MLKKKIFQKKIITQALLFLFTRTFCVSLQITIKIKGAHGKKNAINESYKVRDFFLFTTDYFIIKEDVPKKQFLIRNSLF